jgi:hypothetical protein
MTTYRYTGSDYENGEQAFSTDDMIRIIRNPQLYTSIKRAEELKLKNKCDRLEEKRKRLQSKNGKLLEEEKELKPLEVFTRSIETP